MVEHCIIQSRFVVCVGEINIYSLSIRGRSPHAFVILADLNNIPNHTFVIETNKQLGPPGKQPFHYHNVK